MNALNDRQTAEAAASVFAATALQQSTSASHPSIRPSPEQTVGDDDVNVQIGKNQNNMEMSPLLIQPPPPATTVMSQNNNVRSSTQHVPSSACNGDISDAVEEEALLSNDVSV